MSRHPSVDDLRSWTCWPVTVGPRHRLRLPEGLAEVVGWLRIQEGSMGVLAGRGERGGLRLYPPSQRERILSLMKDLGDSAGISDSASVDLARWLGMTWEVSIEAGGRLTVPEPPRKLGLAPSSAEVGVVFAYGEVLEIWKLQAWERYLNEYGPGIMQILKES